MSLITMTQRFPAYYGHNEINTGNRGRQITLNAELRSCHEFDLQANFSGESNVN
jgi:hypothetical protein